MKHHSIHIIILLAIIYFIISCGEEYEYNEAKKVDNVESYEKFLQKYPDSEYSTEVKDSIMIKRYNMAKEETTKKAYSEFLNYYPDSKFSAEIESLLFPYRRPVVEENKVWISSIPIGLEVKVGKFYTGSSLEAEPVGKTPLLLDLEPGKYTFAVEWPEVERENLENMIDDANIYGYSLQSPDGMSMASKRIQFFYGMLEHTADKFYRWYIFEKSSNKGDSFIALFSPKYNSLKEIDSIYPDGENYLFKKSELEKVLNQKKINDIDLLLVNSLLQRGGKLPLKSNLKYYMLEVDPSSNLVINDH